MKAFLKNDFDVLPEAPLPAGYVAVSVSPEGTYFLSDESPFCLTSNKELAAVFDNYENAWASLEVFKDSIFVETEKQENIVHFFRVEKTENL